MLTRPAFKDHYRVELLPGQGVLLLSEQSDHVLPGPLYERLAPLLVGGETSDAIVDRLALEHTPAEVYYALLELEDRGYLAEWRGAARQSGDGRSRPNAAKGHTTLGRPQPSITIRTVGDVPRDAFVSIVERIGLPVREVADVTVMLTDEYLRPELEEFNRCSLQAHRPWIVVRPSSRVMWVGPLFLPGETCCWKCLEQRLRRNRPARSYLLHHQDGSRTLRAPSVDTASACQAAGTVLARQLASWVAEGARAPVAGAVLTRAMDDRTLRRHVLARRPQCPACGDRTLYARQLSRPLRIASCPKRYTQDGGNRATSPRESARTFARLVSPITGVVRDVRKLTLGDSSPIAVYVAEYDGGSDDATLASLAWSHAANSGGKGCRDSQARASVLGEAIERYSGVFQGDEPRIRASFEELGGRAIHPGRCLQFSEAQYRHRDEWNRRHAPGDYVPIRFDPTERVDWTPVWSLTEEREKYLPTMYLYYGYPVSLDRAFCHADSNGSAAGNTREEAVLQGLLELVERDSVALWWYNRIPRPAVDLEDARSTYCAELQAYYHSLGREFWVLDITSDLSVPCFAAVSRLLRAPAEQIVLGFGAHLDARLALLRALTEMNQVLAVVLTEERAGRAFPLGHQSWFAHASIANQPYLYPDPSSRIRLRDLECVVRADMRDDILWCQRLVEARGMELLVLDQTRPDINVPVCKVIVPGLRPFRARFASGRLYDVPVAQGWLAKARAEADLNPVPVFV